MMPIRSSCVYAVLVGSLLLLPLSACDDSATLGLSVSPDSLRGGDPVTLNIVPQLGSTTSPPITGLKLQTEVPGFGGQTKWRVLVGRVDDPIGGTVQAHGYLDFRGRRTIPERILEAGRNSLSAQLRFRPTYIHGDSSSPVEVQVLTLSEEAKMDRAQADTTFPTGSMVTRASITPTDSIVTVDLPQSWLTPRRASLLRDTSDAGSTFEENFHGFKLAAVEESAVVGFAAGSVSLRLIHTPDSVTAAYQGLKTFTHIERLSPPEEEFPNHKVLQDGIGRGLIMAWDFGSPPLDTLTTAPLNQAQIFVPVDTSAMKATTRSEPKSFVRPFPKGYRITAVRASATSCSAVRTVPTSASDSLCALPLRAGAAPSAALVPNGIAFPIFETSLRQSPVFSEYRVHVADRRSTSLGRNSTVRPGLPSTLPVLIPKPGSEAPGLPRAILTVTPL